MLSYILSYTNPYFNIMDSEGEQACPIITNSKAIEKTFKIEFLLSAFGLHVQALPEFENKEDP